MHHAQAGSTHSVGLETSQRSDGRALRTAACPGAPDARSPGAGQALGSHCAAAGCHHLQPGQHGAHRRLCRLRRPAGRPGRQPAETGTPASAAPATVWGTQPCGRLVCWTWCVPDLCSGARCSDARQHGVTSSQGWQLGQMRQRLHDRAGCQRGCAMAQGAAEGDMRVRVHLWHTAADGAVLPWADHELVPDASAPPVRVKLADPETQASLSGWRHRLQVRQRAGLAVLQLLVAISAETCCGKWLRTRHCCGHACWAHRKVAAAAVPLSRWVTPEAGETLACSGVRR